MKKEYQKDRKEKTKTEKEDDSEGETEKKEEDNEIIEDYKNNLMKYSTLKKQIPKGSSRESLTMSLLAKFKKKLEAAKDKVQEDDEEKNAGAAEDEDENW